MESDRVEGRQVLTRIIQILPMNFIRAADPVLRVLFREGLIIGAFIPIILIWAMRVATLLFVLLVCQLQPRRPHFPFQQTLQASQVGYPAL